MVLNCAACIFASFERYHFQKLSLIIPGYSKEGSKAVQKYRESERFEPSKETEAIVRAKFQ